MVSGDTPQPLPEVLAFYARGMEDERLSREEGLLEHDTSHPPGRSEAGRQQIRDGRPVFEAQMLKLGAIALDGTASTDAVADHLLALAFGDK